MSQQHHQHGVIGKITFIRNFELSKYLRPLRETTEVKVGGNDIDNAVKHMLVNQTFLKSRFLGFPAIQQGNSGRKRNWPQWDVNRSKTSTVNTVLQADPVKICNVRL